LSECVCLLIRMDLGSLLPKVADGDSELVGLEPSSLETLTQSLVFTNSQQYSTRAHTHSYASAAAGTYAHAASVRTRAHVQHLNPQIYRIILAILVIIQKILYNSKVWAQSKNILITDMMPIYNVHYYIFFTIFVITNV